MNVISKLTIKKIVKSILGFGPINKKIKNLESKSHKQKIYKKMEQIDSISETFCSAKWLQVSLLLQNGTNHSCHHPPQHKINIEEIKKNPQALHNTKEKKIARELMLKGERPSECEYCWDIEDLGEKYISDRMIKSTNNDWSLPYLEEILDSDFESNINPRYLEVAFENTCNLKCAYCSPDISSSWLNEIKKFGPYPTRNKQGDLDWIQKSGRLPIRDVENNEYLKSFWEWWPELYKDLRVFRITGGEPLLSENTWKVLELISNKPKSDLTLSINTNLCVSESKIEKLVGYANQITSLINKFEIHTSCEAVGLKAEYIRYGMDYREFYKNLSFVLENTKDSVKVNIMMTFNVLSSESLIEFLNEIKNLRTQYKKKSGHEKLVFMISILKWPTHLSIKVMPWKMRLELVKKLKNYTELNSLDEKNGFLQSTEIDQINRLCEYMSEEHDDSEIGKDRIDFGSFIQEYDKRKKLNFEEVFPGLKSLIE